MDDHDSARLFTLFRDHRDADALAQVFDGLAPGLLKVARYLTRDRSQAEDLLQATFLTAMEKAGTYDDTRPFKPWLTGILILHARKQRKIPISSPDKARIEPPEAREPSEILEKQELEEEVERALKHLPEPYRQVLVQRFKLGLRSMMIARNTGRSPGHVRMQIHRGLKLMRRALPQSLLTALFGFIWSKQALASVRARILAHALAPSTVSKGSMLAAGGMIVSKKILTATAGAALIVGASIIVFLIDTPVDDDLESNSATTPMDPFVAAAKDNGPVQAVERERVRVPPHEEAVKPQASPGRTGRKGRVLDPEGRPVPGVTLVINEQTLETDGRGRFELQTGVPDEAVAVAPPFVLVRRGLTEEGDELLLVVAPRVDLIGTVVDEDGIALPDTLVEVRPIPLVDFPEIIDRTSRVEMETAAVRTDEVGRFELGMLPAGYATLRFEKHGFETRIVRVSEEIAGVQWFTLNHLAAGMHVLTGTVLDPHSRAVPDALVALGEKHRTRTDMTGFFRLEYLRSDIPEDGVSLIAAKRGCQIGMITGFGSKPKEIPLQSYVEIRIGGPTLEISGRLLDAGGEPLAGAFFLLWGEEPVIGESMAEELAVAGEVVPLEDSMHWLQATRESCRSDDNGAFRLRGLSDRSYRLRIVDFEKGFAMTTDPIPAGSANVTIRIPKDAFRETLTGRVINREGEPLSGVRVIVSMWVARHSRRSSLRTLKSVFTGEDGRFDFQGVCRLDTVRVRALGEGILDQERYIEPDDPDEEIILVVEERCHFRVELYDPSSAEGFRILDSRGEVLMIHHFGAIDGDRGYKIFHLVEGKSPVLSVSDRACTLELLGENGRRVPIRLSAGEVTVLGM